MIVIYMMNRNDLDFFMIQDFEWDDGNRQKSRVKHRVDPRECEEVFFNKPLWAHADEKYSQKELRYHALGVTNHGRKLFLSFTIRAHRLRVISARDQSREERKLYENQTK